MARQVGARPAHDTHRLHELRIDRADAEIRVEEDDEEDREEREEDLRRDPEPERDHEHGGERDTRQRVERDEDGLDFTMAWVRHHDRYETAPANR